MKIALNTVTVGPSYSLEAILKEMGRWGYQGVEIEVGRLKTFLEKHSLQELKTLLRDQGITVAGLMAWPFLVTDLKEELLEDLRRCGDWARELEAPALLVFAGEGGPSDPSQKGDFLRRAGERACQYAEAAGEGVKIALEPIGGSSWLGNPQDALAIAQASGHPRVGIMMDLFHYYKSSVPAREVEAIPLDKLLIVHTDDCLDLPIEELNDSHRVYPGEGILPIKSRLRLLRAKGYRGFLSIELFNRDYWSRPLGEVVERCWRSMARILAEV